MMKKSIGSHHMLGVLAASTMVLVAAAIATGAAVAPDPSAATETQSPSLEAGSTIYLPSGEPVVLPKAWGELTISELAELGIVPNMGSGDGVQDEAVVVSASATTSQAPARLNQIGPSPQSADGCNLYVCIEVTGSGLTVSDWITEADPTVTICSYAAFWKGAYVQSTSGTVCGSSGDVFLAVKSGLPIIYNNNTKLCNSWANISGKPCITVHS